MEINIVHAIDCDLNRVRLKLNRLLLSGLTSTLWLAHVFRRQRNRKTKRKRFWREMKRIRSLYLFNELLIFWFHSCTHGHTVVFPRTTRGRNGGEFSVSRWYFALSREASCPDGVRFPPAWISGEVERHAGHPRGLCLLGHSNKLWSHKEHT